MSVSVWPKRGDDGGDQFYYMPPPPPGAEWWACETCGSEWLRVTGKPCDPCWTCDEARGVLVPSEYWGGKSAFVRPDGRKKAPPKA